MGESVNQCNITVTRNMHYLAPEMVGDFNDSKTAVSDHKTAKLAKLPVISLCDFVTEKITYENVEYICNKCVRKWTQEGPEFSP